MSAITISEIWIYPVKSLGGIRVQKARVLGKGLQYDRRYMLADENNQFITQRVAPDMALFKLSFGDNAFLVSFKDESLEIPLVPTQTKEAKTATIWEDKVLVFELGNEFNEWFSERLSIKCKLIYFPEENRRAVDKNFATQDEQVSFADGYPFLIIGQRSLDHLNTRLMEPVPMNRFRPNFVFDGGSPFEEDWWKNFKIGKNRFVGLKQCSRCTLTTVNQETAEKGVEPLATLSKFRKNGSKVNFGQNLVAIDYDEVNEGDAISIESLL